MMGFFNLSIIEVFILDYYLSRTSLQVQVQVQNYFLGKRLESAGKLLSI